MKEVNLYMLLQQDISNSLLITWGKSKAKRTVAFSLVYNNIPLVNTGDEHGGTAHFSATNITKTNFYLKAYTYTENEFDDLGNYIAVGYQ